MCLKEMRKRVRTGGLDPEPEACSNGKNSAAAFGHIHERVARVKIHDLLTVPVLCKALLK
jgi:hypothetical protein